MLPTKSSTFQSASKSKREFKSIKIKEKKKKRKKKRGEGKNRVPSEYVVKREKLVAMLM